MPETIVNTAAGTGVPAAVHNVPATAALHTKVSVSPGGNAVGRLSLTPDVQVAVTTAPPGPVTTTVSPQLIGPDGQAVADPSFSSNSVVPIQFAVPSGSPAGIAIVCG